MRLLITQACPSSRCQNQHCFSAVPGNLLPVVPAVPQFNSMLKLEWSLEQKCTVVTETLVQTCRPLCGRDHGDLLLLPPLQQ